jgi:hypothetical protein
MTWAADIYAWLVDGPRAARLFDPLAPSPVDEARAAAGELGTPGLAKRAIAAHE